jgi:hypothetical protein
MARRDLRLLLGLTQLTPHGGPGEAIAQSV